MDRLRGFVMTVVRPPRYVDIEPAVAEVRAQSEAITLRLNEIAREPDPLQALLREMGHHPARPGGWQW